MNINTAVLLVGGKGTRLYPLTKTRPKPLVPFLNKPIIEYQIETLVKSGIKRIILCLNYFSEQLQEAAEQWENKYGVEIIMSRETETLGTAGPVKLAEPHITGDSFVLMNTDIYSYLDLTGMINQYITQHSDNKILSMLLTTEVEDTTRYGLVKIKDGLVVDFLEKSKTTTPGLNKINAGIYILHKEVIDLIELKEVSIEREIFPQLAKNGKMGMFELEGVWCDIGVPREYLIGQKMALDYLNNNSNNNVVIGKNVRIGENVTLEDCTIFDNCVICDDCVIKNAIIGCNSVINAGTIINKDITTVLADNSIVSNKNDKVRIPIKSDMIYRSVEYHK